MNHDGLQRLSCSSTRSARLVLLLILSICISACSSLPASGAAAPATIAVRNSTGKPIEVITFSSAENGSDRSVRIGSISPLPRGVTQYIGRGSQAPALPKQGILTWIDHQGLTVVREVNAGLLTNSSTKTSAEILLIELLSDGSITLRFEQP